MRKLPLPSWVIAFTVPLLVVLTIAQVTSIFLSPYIVSEKTLVKISGLRPHEPTGLERISIFISLF